jgi:hypothetical protein
MGFPIDIIKRLLNNNTPIPNPDYNYLTGLPGFDAGQLGLEDRLNQARNSVDELFEERFGSDPAKRFEVEHIDLLARDPEYIFATDADLMERAAEGFARVRTGGLGPGNPSMNKGLPRNGSAWKTPSSD